LAAGTVESFVGGFTHTSTLVSSPGMDDLLRAVLVAAPAATVDRQSEQAAVIAGLGSAQIGEIAAAESIVLHHLASRTATLEEAFFEATGASEEYVGRRQPSEAIGGTP
jgi:ABC-2 type transport system ATP-binding protein